MNNAKEERVTDLSIIMEMIDSKPYYSLQYRNVGEIGCHIGYSSYNLKTVLEFKAKLHHHISRVISFMFVKHGINTLSA